MRISDWSSDVCSSDLCRITLQHLFQFAYILILAHHVHQLHNDELRRIESLAFLVRTHTQIQIVHENMQAGSDALVIGLPIVRTTGDHLCMAVRSEEHTSELQSLMRISYAVF